MPSLTIPTTTTVGYITVPCGNIYSGDKANATNTCFDPTKQYADQSSNERTTHELRISSDLTIDFVDGWRLLQ